MSRFLSRDSRTACSSNLKTRSVYAPERSLLFKGDLRLAGGVKIPSARHVNSSLAGMLSTYVSYIELLVSKLGSISSCDSCDCESNDAHCRFLTLFLNYDCVSNDALRRWCEHLASIISSLWLLSSSRYYISIFSLSSLALSAFDIKPLPPVHQKDPILLSVYLT